MEFRQDYFLLILLVISAFQIYFQETVEFHLVCLDGEFLVPLVGSYLMSVFNMRASAIWEAMVRFQMRL